MDVHLRDLRYFVAVAEELHFTRAAERLHITQPTLTRQIRRLERDLRMPLFERDHRTVALTEAGKELLVVARGLLDQWTEGLSNAASAGTTLRIGLQTALGRGLPGTLGRSFGSRLVFRQYPWSDPTAGLGSGEVDAAFVWLPLPGPDRFRWRVIRTEPRWAMLPIAHPLAARESVTMDDLRDEPFIALPSDIGSLRDFWLAADHRTTPARVAAEASTLDEKLEAVAAGIGICLIAQGNIALYSRPDVTARPITDLSPAHLALAWQATDHRPVLHTLISALTTAGHRRLNGDQASIRGE